MNELPRPIKMKAWEKEYWLGLSRQELSFHQAMCELIDNCISASRDKNSGNKKPFNIEISIEKIDSKIKVIVIDQGIGISESDLEEIIFNPGGSSEDKGILNEHGFGLKNSLCVMTEGIKYDWKVITRNEEALENNRILKVVGPFNNNMELEAADEYELNSDNELNIKNTGTRIEVTTSFDFFSTIYKRGRIFSTLVTRFIEHIGVIYKVYLDDEYSKMKIRWKDSSDLTSDWEEHFVKPIKIHYDADGATKYDLIIPGDSGEVEIKYVAGKLDKEKTCENKSEIPYPLKIYYQGNQSTQGIDLIVRGRLLKSGVLTKIWGTERHNNMNSFVGELIINDKRFRTVNNKLGLDPNNQYTVNLLKELKSDDKYRIERITNNQIESSIKKKFAKFLHVMYKDGLVSPEHSIWSGSGVKIDMYTRDKDNEITIYEFKTTVARPIDVYQLLMYWDGVVKDEQRSPNKALLVAAEISDKIHLMIQDINERTDALENSYMLDTSTIEEMGILA